MTLHLWLQKSEGLSMVENKMNFSRVLEGNLEDFIRRKSINIKVHSPRSSYCDNQLKSSEL